MNKETLEHISSLMDGELSRETGMFLTRRLSADKELAGTWQRYHLIRDCMRRPGNQMPMVDLSSRMQDALSGEDAPVSGRQPNRWLRPVGGLAIAASVALMAIVAVGPGQPLQDQQMVSEDAVQPFTSPNILPAVPRTQAASFTPPSQAREARLNSYLLRHNQSSGSFTSPGFLGFVPIVSQPDAAANEEEAVAENAEDTESEAR
jgi:sigma-E factor negative regulatory protein RseA